MRGIRHHDQSIAAKRARNTQACARYRASQDHAAQRRFRKTAKYKAARRKFNLTPAGKEACRKNNIKQRCRKYGRVYEEHVTPMPADGCCPYCRIKMIGVYPALDTPTVDHTAPLTGGGDHVPGNTRMACLDCNRMKGNNPVANLLAKLAARMPVVPDRRMG